MDAQMKKGVLELCLLHLISTRETYGYELLSEMRKAFPDVSESTVYAVLRRIQADNLATTFSGEASGGPARRYLKITESGTIRLKAIKKDWRVLLSSVANLGVS